MWGMSSASAAAAAAGGGGGPSFVDFGSSPSRQTIASSLNPNSVAFSPATRLQSHHAGSGQSPSPGGRSNHQQQQQQLMYNGGGGPHQRQLQPLFPPPPNPVLSSSGAPQQYQVQHQARNFVTPQQRAQQQQHTLAMAAMAAAAAAGGNGPPHGGYQDGYRGMPAWGGLDQDLSPSGPSVEQQQQQAFRQFTAYPQPGGGGGGGGGGFHTHHAHHSHHHHHQHHHHSQQHLPNSPPLAWQEPPPPRQLLQQRPPTTHSTIGKGSNSGRKQQQQSSLSPDHDERVFDTLTKDIWKTTEQMAATASPPGSSGTTAAASAGMPGNSPREAAGLQSVLAVLAGLPTSSSGASALSGGPLAPQQQQRAAAAADSGADGAFAVQHLLAQLTTEGHAEELAMRRAQQHTQPSPSAASSLDASSLTGASAAASPDSAPSSTSHRGGNKGPPAAIGSSPTNTANSQSPERGSPLWPGGAHRTQDASLKASTPTQSPNAKGTPTKKQQQQQQQQNQKAEKQPASPKPSADADGRKAHSASLSSSGAPQPQPAPPTAAAAAAAAASPAARWPPTTRAACELYLRQHNAPETHRHVKILSFSRQHPAAIADLFKQWAAKGIPAPDDVFGAYYHYVAGHSAKELCMKHNGRGKVPGVGYGGCDFSDRGSNYKCRFLHQCLFCRAEDHGWFDETRCTRYLAFRAELERLKIGASDIDALVDAYDRK